MNFIKAQMVASYAVLIFFYIDTSEVNNLNFCTHVKTPIAKVHKYSDFF